MQTRHSLFLMGFFMATMNTYLVLLSRVDSKAGPKGNLKVEVKAPDPQTAKRTAEAQYPGYKYHSSSRVAGK